jgi:hypothetical protein
MRYSGLLLLLSVLILAALRPGPIGGSVVAVVPEGIPLPEGVTGWGVEISADMHPPDSTRAPALLTPLLAPPAAADGCAASSVLPIPVPGIASAPTVVNDFSTSATDPDISACMLGQPANPRGYRSAWYRIVPPVTGVLHVEAVPNFDFADDYDTVIAIFEGSCNALTLGNCNDDYNGFLSRTSHDVIKGETYYVLTTDRNLALNGTARLNLQAWIETYNNWETETGWNDFGHTFRSRHAAVVVGESIYVFGGQTTEAGQVVRTGASSRFDTPDGTWHVLTPMPGDCDINGYSNAGVVHLDGKIYFPSGYVGDNTVYSGTHCVYDIASNGWNIAARAPWADNQPAIYAPVVGRPSARTYYVIGGLTGPWLNMPPDTRARQEVYLYSTTINSWAAQPTLSLTQGRYAHAGALLQDRYLCVAGGLRPNPPTTDLLFSLECLDLFNTGPGWQQRARMVVPRFNASSFVGPDGQWYLVGGMTLVGTQLQPVELIERYDYTTDRWEVVDRRYDLLEPARVWPQGGFIGRTLWLIGGEQANGTLVPVVERATLPPSLPALPHKSWLPLVFGPELVRVNNEPDDTILTARPIPLNTPVGSNFDDVVNDRFDMHRITLEQDRYLSIRLTHIPGQDNYDLYLYSANKVQWGASRNIGNLDERIDILVPAGTYYILVVAQYNHPFSTGTYYLDVQSVD